MTAAAQLAGRHIVITRAREQSSRLCELLTSMGANVISIPAIEIAPPLSFHALDDALQRLGSFQWLVFASVNAVRVFGDRWRHLGLTPAILGELQTAAVGAATAAAAAALGLRVAVVPQRYVGDQLAAALRERTRGQRVLIVRAQLARDVIPQALREAGAQVETAEAYRTIVPAGSATRVRALFSAERPPDAALFASSSAVRHFLCLLEEAETGRPAALKAVSIGPITSRTLRENGWEPASEAAEATVEALANACAQLFSAWPGSPGESGPGTRS